MRPGDKGSLLGRWWQRKSEKPQLSRQDALRVYPMHSPQLEWTLDSEGLVTATLVRRTDLWGRLLANFFSIPDSRELKLDRVGSHVWQLCDGERTANEVIVAMCEEYKLSRREVEVSFIAFMRLLAKRGMVVVAVPKDIVDSLDPAMAAALGVTNLLVREPKASSQQAEETDAPEGDAGPEASRTEGEPS